MLVVTIIIAAVVSAFAGSMGSEQHKTPQATIVANGIVQGIQDTNTANWKPDYPGSDYTTLNGLQFENTGGDSFVLNDIEVQVQAQDAKYTLTTKDRLPSSTCLPAGSTSGGYFLKVGNTSLSDALISPGDKFMLYADNCYDSSTATYKGQPYAQGRWITWDPAGTQGGFAAQLNTKIQYKLIDRRSSRAIASGEIILR